jgi:hypothetical protein
MEMTGRRDPLAGSGMHNARRLEPTATRARDTALKIGANSLATPFEPMPGRPMREYVVVPASVVDRTMQLRTCLDRGRSFAALLPPKQAATKATKGEFA